MPPVSLRRLVHRCSKVRKKFSRNRNKLAPGKPFSLPSPSPSQLGWDDDELSSSTASSSTASSSSLLLSLPYEVVELIIQAIIDVDDFTTTAAFAAASSTHKEMIERALIAAYKRHDLSESAFRHYLQLDYSIFDRQHLAEHRMAFCRRYYNSHDEKQMGYWQKTLEERLLKGKNTFILSQPDTVTFFSSSEHIESARTDT